MLIKISHFYLQDQCVVYLTLCEDKTCQCLDASLLLYANNANLQYVHVFMYMDVVHSSGLYK